MCGLFFTLNSSAVMFPLIYFQVTFLAIGLAGVAGSIFLIWGLDEVPKYSIRKGKRLNLSNFHGNCTYVTCYLMFFCQQLINPRRKNRQ